MPHNPDPTALCQHHSKDGKRCHMLLAPDSPSLCPFHARSHAKRTASQHDDSADLSAIFSQDLPKQKSAADIHTHLWNLSLALQQGRISPRRAAVLAYINSLLLRTLPAISQQQDSAPQKIIIDIPGAIRHFPEDDELTASPDFSRGERGESSDSHPATFTPPPPAAPPSTPDDPRPSTHPKPVPLPRWGEVHGTIRQPERPNTYGPPRMRARRSPRHVAPRRKFEIARRMPKTLCRASGARASWELRQTRIFSRLRSRLGRGMESVLSIAEGLP